MKYLKKFKSLADANEQGGGGLYSPHIDIIEGMDVVNYMVTDTETFKASFDESGKIKEKKKETWQFKYVPNKFSYVTGDEVYYIKFNSNEQEYNSFKIIKNPPHYYLYYDEMQVSHADMNRDRFTWLVDDAFHTVVLDEQASDDLLTFLQNNANRIN